MPTQETEVGSGRSPGVENDNHSSILAWKIPWTEEPGGLQWGRKRVKRDGARNKCFRLLNDVITILMDADVVYVETNGIFSTKILAN